MENTIWLNDVSILFQSILKKTSFKILSKLSVGIHILPDVVEKINAHASTCAKCRAYKRKVLEHLQELDTFFENNNFKRVDDISVLDQNKLRYSWITRVRPARDHLINDHGYYLNGTFRFRVGVLGFMIGIILYLLRVPSWYFIFSLILAILGYLIGDSLEKKYEKKGMIIRKISPSSFKSSEG
ncbi:hypothetical protein BKI52_31385 [marine bacterium AO1-C]|nr:hypothetical protein BKI52_31385 [marine bacterium AO1-C]